MRFTPKLKKSAVSLALLLALSGVCLHAADAPKTNSRLEDMTAAELKEALKKSHAELSARLGSDSADSEPEMSGKKTAALSEKRAYETSAQGRIDRLSQKIDDLDNSHVENWGYSHMDADRLRQIQSRAQDELNTLRATDTEDWKSHKQGLESILREAPTI